MIVLNNDEMLKNLDNVLIRVMFKCVLGTGSGSVTHSLAKTVYPNGHVHTFEYHKERSTAAVNEFESHGLSNVVTVYNQDVYVSGFKQLNNIADAVFLDLPLPWIVIPHLLTCFKQRGDILQFFPLI